MAATFIVENGSVVLGANAYITVAEADQYHENHDDPSSWSGAITSDKEEAIRQATQYLDAFYHVRWKGRRIDDDQDLDWPRFNVHDRDNFIIDSDEIPQKLKDACAVMALRSLGSVDLLPDLDNPGTEKRRRIKVGPVEKDIEYFDGRSQIKKFRLVDLLLIDFINPKGFVERG